jgi:hypothetical protein
MIQRIQSIYLLSVAIVSGGLIFFLDLWKDDNNSVWHILNTLEHNSLLIKSVAFLFWFIALLAIFSLFSFKKRKFQIRINRINILINFILFGILTYLLLNLSGEIIISEKGIGSFLPLVSIALLVFANFAIQKDENLVKSVDRLR